MYNIFTLDLACYLYMDNAAGGFSLANIINVVFYVQKQCETYVSGCGCIDWKTDLNTSGYGECGKVIFGDSESGRVVGSNA